MRRLENKVAVITGASSGMGRATAIRFSQEGASVVVADLNVSGGESVVRECKENGGNAVFQKADVSSEEQVKAMIDRAVKEFGRLDITYNNAGLGGAVGPIENITVEDWDKTFAVLVRGVFLGIKHSIPIMRKQGGGSIISTASLAGLQGYDGIHAYSGAKAAVVNVTRSAAIQLGPDKSRVNCICPGGINTPILYGTTPGGEKIMEKTLARLQPIKRAGSPFDIANMALFLASDESEWITGAAMVVDGGAIAGESIQLARDAETNALPPSGFAGPSFQR